VGDFEVISARSSVAKSEGRLSLTSDHPYGFQAGDLKVTSSIPFAAPDESVVSGGLMGAAINVGEVYAQLVHDVHAGTHIAPGFEHALHNARLIEAGAPPNEASGRRLHRCPGTQR
jgi:hypothetical protein